MKVGTSGVFRALVSLVDYARFYEIGLAPRPGLLLAAVAGWIACLGASLWFGDRIWLGPAWASGIVFAAPVLGMAVRFLRANAPSKTEFKANELARDMAMNSIPDEVEQALGFERVSRRSNFDGPIIVSDDFNIGQFSDPSVDWPVTINANDPRYQGFINVLKPDRKIFVDYGLRAARKAIMSGKALINEGKVAFSTPFPPAAPGTEIGLMRTDYFAGLCTAERSLNNAEAVERGQTVTRSHADARNVFRDGTGRAVLPKLVDNHRPVSLHFGVEVMAVSSDGILRVPVQSALTQVSQNMRAPLASGSVDWEDTQGATTLKGVLRQAARRELSEEWGAKSPKVAQKLLGTLPEPIGYFRNPLRCGKPQFVTFVRLPVTDAELAADKTEVTAYGLGPVFKTGTSPRSVFPVETIDQLIDAMDEILGRRAEKTDSLPLLGAAHILRNIAAERPERIEAILAR